MTRRSVRTVAACVVVAATAIPAAAEAQAPAERYAVGTPALQAAQQIARAHWGVDPCGGQVELVWADDEAAINARATWSNPVAAYGTPEHNASCRITLNPRIPFDWVKLCTVVVHEYGHLAGHPHGEDGPDVMSPLYRAPLPACAAAPDPAPVAAPTVSRSAGTPRTRRASLRTPRPSSSGRARRP